MVALHPEGVDRNISGAAVGFQKSVALHPEGVDRNQKSKTAAQVQTAVALHPEGVDRNHAKRIARHRVTSPSTRRAWIEISFLCAQNWNGNVALHPEGVDRNALMKS